MSWRKSYLYRERAKQDVFAQSSSQRRRLWFSFRLADKLPDWPCCYVIYDQDQLKYVGSTTNLEIRSWRHKFNFSSEAIIKVKLCRKYGEWAMIEARLIDRLQPPMNRAGIRKMIAA